MTPFCDRHVLFWSFETLREGSDGVLQASAIKVFAERFCASTDLRFLFFSSGEATMSRERISGNRNAMLSVVFDARVTGSGHNLVREEFFVEEQMNGAKASRSRGPGYGEAALAEIAQSIDFLRWK
jgi:hypothetical protein